MNDAEFAIRRFESIKNHFRLLCLRSTFYFETKIAKLLLGLLGFFQQKLEVAQVIGPDVPSPVKPLEALQSASLRASCRYYFERVAYLYLPSTAKKGLPLDFGDWRLGSFVCAAVSLGFAWAWLASASEA